MLAAHAESHARLCAEELRQLGTAMFRVGAYEDAAVQMERAFAAHIEAGQPRPALRVALRVYP